APHANSLGLSISYPRRLGGRLPGRTRGGTRKLDILQLMIAEIAIVELWGPRRVGAAKPVTDCPVPAPRASFRRGVRHGDAPSRIFPSPLPRDLNFTKAAERCNVSQPALSRPTQPSHS